MSDTPALSESLQTFRLETDGVVLQRALTALCGAVVVSSLCLSGLRYQAWWAQLGCGMLIAWLWQRLGGAIGARTRVDLSLADGLVIDGEPCALLAVEWRGHLAFLSFRTGARTGHRLLWLGPQQRRREFKLALLRMQAAQGRQTMAT